MHLVGVKKTLVKKYPWLPMNLLKAFTAAKDIAIGDMDALTALPLSLPWLGAELAATRELLGDDVWPYGAAANAKEIEALIRYSAEQGLTNPPVVPETLFAASTMATAKV
jgi:4,5-dihydroxyphthalate decarboxylase